ncbi:hypothetical protein AGLY_016359 [Aphis glycines]|uniref:Uncharacterized protein n=1 Tax=Aphis glycines TaxID=307491 RepID=A0A6G0SY56_APHGL|nr:hypothetical protein AGLY_016359 [Aphis glycines]
MPYGKPVFPMDKLVRLIQLHTKSSKHSPPSRSKLFIVSINLTLSPSNSNVNESISNPNNSLSLMYIINILSVFFNSIVIGLFTSFCLTWNCTISSCGSSSTSGTSEAYYVDPNEHMKDLYLLILQNVPMIFSTSSNLSSLDISLKIYLFDLCRLRRGLDWSEVLAVKFKSSVYSSNYKRGGHLVLHQQQFQSGLTSILCDKIIRLFYHTSVANTDSDV